MIVVQDNLSQNSLFLIVIHFKADDRRARQYNLSQNSLFFVIHSKADFALSFFPILFQHSVKNIISNCRFISLAKKKLVKVKIYLKYV